jgi:Winged helix DNA-binding domain
VIRTLTAAAAWVDEVGLALVFPKADAVLPSLWEQVNGSAEANWAIRGADGSFVRWTDAMGFLWRAKDELPEQGLVCVGKHVARVAACVSPRLVPLLAAANREEPEESEALVADAVRELGPLTSPALRETTGLTKKETDKAVVALHRKLVLTNAHLAEGDRGWGAIAHDLLGRKWRLPKRLASREDARRELAAHVLQQVGELTAADLAGLFGWRRKDAALLLDEVGAGRDDDAGFRIWTRR